jgi:hypothetical protein
MRLLFLVTALCSCLSTWADKPSTTPLVASENPTTQEVRDALTKEFKGKGDLVRRSVRRLGHKTIELQAFVSIEGNFEQAAQILANFQKDPSWALKGINDSPSGRSYYFKITKANPEPPNILSFSFVLELPLYQHKGVRKFKLTSKRADGSFLFEGESLPDPESVISSCSSRVYVFPAVGQPDRLWIAAMGRIEIKPWILYEALPERILTNESTERLETLIGNYQKQEDALRLPEGNPKKE